jgi:hypothetical protein
MRDIRTLLKAVEAARVETKKPVLDMAAAIDRTAKEFAQDLRDEEMRLGTAASEWAQAEMERVRAAERARQAELDRIENERKAALEAAGDDDKAKAAADERARQEVIAIPAAAPKKAEGQVVREVWEFEVTDTWLLARTMPALVRIEVNRQECNEVIARLAANGEPKIPGLRIWKSTKVSVRAERGGKVVDV